ncbi:MAG: hypothetical protein ACI32F_06515 [Allobaculum sp.]
MKEDLRRDIIVPITLFLLFGVLGDTTLFGIPFVLPILTLIPVICYILAITGSRKPTEIYVRKKKKKNKRYKAWNEPKYQNHPVVMPRMFCVIEAILCMILGFVTFILFPISSYFFNWSSVYWAMADGKVAPIPDLPDEEMRNGQYEQQKCRQQDPNQQSSEDLLRNMGEATARFFESEEVKDAARTIGAAFKDVASEVGANMKKASTSSTNTSKQTTATRTKTQSAPSQDEIARQLKFNVISQIEKNDAELQGIKATLKTTLESMFGGSKITIAKYQAGIEEAIEMSSQNLQAAKEYAKGGSNPGVMKTFLDRSNMINQKTGELLDALVTHQQNLMEDDMQDLTSSLEDLQDSLKYYH